MTRLPASVWDPGTETLRWRLACRVACGREGKQEWAGREAGLNAVTTKVSANPKENPRARVVLQSFPKLGGRGSQAFIPSRSSVIGYRLSLDRSMILGMAMFFSKGNPPIEAQYSVWSSGLVSVAGRLDI